MSIWGIRRVLEITTSVGKGTTEDPCRTIQSYVDADTLEVIFVRDQVLEHEMRLKANNASPDSKQVQP